MRYVNVFIKVFALITCLATNCFAGSTPEATVHSAIKELKSTGQPSAILNYVHWQTAFNQMSPMYRAQINADSPEALKSFYSKALKDPSEAMKGTLEGYASQLPPEQQAMMKQQMEKLGAMMKQRLDEAKKKLVEADYEIGKASVEGNDATLKLVATRGEETRSHDLKLIKIGEQWYFPSLDLVNADSLAGGKSAAFPPGMAPQQMPPQQMRQKSPVAPTSPQ